MKKLRMVSLCSGIGGADLAAEWTGAIEVVGQVEINTFCQAVLSKHWPSVLRFSDIKEIRGDEFGAIDAPHIRERCFVVAHSDSEQSQRRRIPGKLERAQTGGQGPEEERQRIRYAAFDCGQDVAHPSSAGWEEWDPAAVASEQGGVLHRPTRIAASKRGREWDTPPHFPIRYGGNSIPNGSSV